MDILTRKDENMLRIINSYENISLPTYIYITRFRTETANETKEKQRHFVDIIEACKQFQWIEA